MTLYDDYFRYVDKWNKEFGAKTLVLMQVGSFFEVYGLRDTEGVITKNDMKVLEKMTGLNIATKSGLYEDKSILMAGFGLGQFGKYTKYIREHDYTIVIYKQVTSSGNEITREFSEIISPGTVFDEDDDSISNVTMSLWIEHVKATRGIKESIVMGVSTLDIFTGVTTMHEITELYNHAPNTYDELEKIVSIYYPKEAIIISNMETDITNEIISFIGLDNCKNYVVNYTSENHLLTKYIENADKQTYQKAAMYKYYPELSDECIITDVIQQYGISLQSFVVLLDYMYEHNCDFTSQLRFPEFKHETTKLVLANHSLKQLNILDDSRHRGKFKSVSSFLDNCKTIMGTRKFLHDLHNPINNIDILNEGYKMTDNVITTGEWEYYRISLAGIIDLEKFRRALLMKRTSPKKFAKLFANMETIMEMANNTRTYNDDVHEYTTRSGDPISNCTRLLEKISETFVIENAAFVSEVTTEYLSGIPTERLHFIKHGVSENIDSALEEYENRLEIRYALQVYLSSLVAMSENRTQNTEYVKHNNAGKSDPYLFATKKRALNLKKNIGSLKSVSLKYTSKSGISKEYVLDLEDIVITNKNSSKSESIITSKQIKEIMGNIALALDKIIVAITTFYRELLDDMITYCDSMDVVIAYVENIDTLQNKAYIASKYNYCRPVIQADAAKSFCDFTAIRHPLIEHIQVNELYVTNDLSIGKEESNFDGLLLYGTNAVGKTSLIRSIGIAVVMAQAGLYVPCASFKFYPYDYIFTRILGNDNLFKGLSTFAVEMCELRTILKMATKNSIILGDELCSGTDSNSALSIFTAGLESLSEKNSTFVFATHFHEITEYDEIKNISKIKMMHMEVIYNSAKDCLEYNRKLQMGPGTSMYGLEVCKSLGLPGDFTDRAHSIRLKYNPEASGALSQKKSHYNANKVRGLCEICNLKPGDDIHHLQYKSRADSETGYIGDFGRNHPANLANVCKDCHDNIHRDNSEYRKTKTTIGNYFKHI
jgi:DNA mismatch repair protein MutS|tara:strand:+ start:414 stop:3407 length:2994 start_codon:yes stop_codon:yes gene_type:complete